MPLPRPLPQGRACACGVGATARPSSRLRVSRVSPSQLPAGELVGIGIGTNRPSCSGSCLARPAAYSMGLSDPASRILCEAACIVTRPAPAILCRAAQLRRNIVKKSVAKARGTAPQQAPKLLAGGAGRRARKQQQAPKMLQQQPQQQQGGGRRRNKVRLLHVASAALLPSCFLLCVARRPCALEPNLSFS